MTTQISSPAERDETPPYVAFHHVDTFLEAMSPVLLPGPEQITRTRVAEAVPGISTNDQLLVIRALRFFGLLDAQDITTSLFSDYVSGDAAAKQNQWKALVQQHYADCLPALLQGNRAQVKAFFSTVRSATGAPISTRLQERCGAFLVRAAERAGFEVPRPIPAPLSRTARHHTPVPQPAAPQAGAGSTTPLHLSLDLEHGFTCVLTHDGPLPPEARLYLSGLLCLLAMPVPTPTLSSQPPSPAPQAG